MAKIINDLVSPFMRTMYEVWEDEGKAAAEPTMKEEKKNVHDTPTNPGRIPKKHR